MPTLDQQALLDTIVTLAFEIGQRSPDCADHAARIASLAGQIAAAKPDRGAIQDTLDAQMSDTDLSDSHVRSTTEAVVRTMDGTP